MNTLDLVITGAVALLAILGYLQGFIIGMTSLLGLALGGVVGTRVSRELLGSAAGDGAATSPWAPMIGLGIGLLITLVGALAMQDIGNGLRRRIRRGESAAVDHMLGAVLLAAVGLLLAWFTAAAAIGVPQLRELRPMILESRLVSTMNTAMPPAGPILGALASYDPFPRFDGGRILAGAPDATLPRDPQVRRAARSVVRISGVACGYRITGSGWVAAPGYVVTNAHVVAGHDSTDVQVGGRADQALRAEVVSFDRDNDVAVLRVDGLELRPLQAVDGAANTAGAVLGYPENGAFRSTAARFGGERRVSAEDIYGSGPVERRITSFRGVVRHGNSGGPFVDGEGRVLTTVFAASVGSRVAGGYGVPNSTTEQRLAEARRVPDGFGVRTGPCIS